MNDFLCKTSRVGIVCTIRKAKLTKLTKGKKMANPLINALKNLLFETKAVVSSPDQEDAKNARLQEAKAKLQKLQMTLDMQYRMVNAEWMRENNALFNRPAAQRMFYFKNNQLIKRRMLLLGHYKASVDKAVQTIAAAQDQIKFNKSLADATLDPSQVEQFQKDLIDTKARVDEGLRNIDETSTLLDSQVQAFETMVGMDVMNESDKKAQELMERYETCVSNGDEKGAKAAKDALDEIQNAQMKDMLTGGGSF